MLLCDLTELISGALHGEAEVVVLRITESLLHFQTESASEKIKEESGFAKKISLRALGYPSSSLGGTNRR